MFTGLVVRKMLTLEKQQLQRYQIFFVVSIYNGGFKGGKCPQLGI
jgi:hypothetical protein